MLNRAQTVWDNTSAQSSASNAVHNRKNIKCLGGMYCFHIVDRNSYRNVAHYTVCYNSEGILRTLNNVTY
jgi:hypothetical protein